MPRTRAIRFAAPWLGKQGRTAYSDANHPYVQSSLNFWPFDAKTNRERLAICPGYDDFGSVTGVNLIATLDVSTSGSDLLATPTPTTYGRLLMIAYAGELYKHDTGAETFTQVGGSNIIDTGRNVQATSYYNKLYVANTTSQYQQYDYKLGTVTPWTSSPDTIPIECPLICTWSARIVLSGNVNQPHVVNFSRTDDPDDWDVSKRDRFAAISVPDISQPVTALMPHDRDCLVVGTYNSLWIFSGNPTGGGSLYKLPSVVGPINGTAWCSDDLGALWMLTRNGLYVMTGRCGSAPQPVSRDIIPESLVGLDGVTNKAYLAYDTLFNCLHIYISGGDSFHYFPPRDGRQGSFWPVSAPYASISAIGRYNVIETTDASGVLIGTGGNLKRLDRTTDVASVGHVKSLFPVAPPGRKALVNEVYAVFGDNTEDTTGTVALYGAETAEDVVAAPAGFSDSTTIGAIQNNHHRFPARVSGQSQLLTITQAGAANHISLEHATLFALPQGKERG